MPIDGGFATELEAMDYDLSSDLWSARLLEDGPAAVEAVRPGLRIAFARASSPATPPTRLAGMPSTDASGRTMRDAIIATPTNEPRTPTPSIRSRSPVGMP